MIKKTIKLLRNQKGYGTVELLILVAALGLLAVTVTDHIRQGNEFDSSKGSECNGSSPVDPGQSPTIRFRHILHPLSHIHSYTSHHM